MSALPELSDKDRLRARVLSDTGVLCRELLGYNYDEDEFFRHVNVGKGGIVDHGKTQEIIELLDNKQLRYKLIIAPRESRKSTMLQGFIIRNILLWPDIRIFYVTRNDALMQTKCAAIRNQLESEAVTALFGDQRGDKWAETEFNVRGRTARGLQNATLTGFSQDSMVAGGRANLIVVDDFIDHKNVTTAEQNKKSKDLHATLQPFLARGGTIVNAATIWAEDDLNHSLMSSPLYRPPYGGQIVCGAGVRVITTPEGSLDLEVLPTGLTFPHLTLEHLRQRLWGMAREGKYEQFVRQYLNEVGSSTDSYFQRRFFQPLKWGEDMRQLSGYLVTDTIGASAKDTPDNCYAVVGYLGLDASDNLYLLDLLVGRPDPTEFCEWFFEVLERWYPKVNHCGECWEDVSLSNAYRHYIRMDARARRLRLRTIEMKRPAQSEKQGRINRLQPVMKAGNFYVVDTVPKTFVDTGGEKELWNPAGFFDARSQKMLPSGELVDEFIRASSKKDIPDALAMILEYERTRTGFKRLCGYKPYRPPEPAWSLTRQRSDQYHQEQYGPASAEDWWDKTLRDNGI